MVLEQQTNIEQQDVLAKKTLKLGQKLLSFFAKMPIQHYKVQHLKGN